MHTSLSGSFNDAMVKKVGCDNFLSSSSRTSWWTWWLTA